MRRAARWPHGWTPADPVTGIARTFHAASSVPREGWRREPVWYTESGRSCTIHIHEEDTHEIMDLSFFRHAVIQLYMAYPIYCRRAYWLAASKHRKWYGEGLAHDLVGAAIVRPVMLPRRPLHLHGGLHYGAILSARASDIVHVLDEYDGTMYSIRIAVMESEYGAYTVSLGHVVEDIAGYAYRRADRVAGMIAELAGASVDPDTVRSIAREATRMSDEPVGAYTVADMIARETGVDSYLARSALLNAAYMSAIEGDVQVELVAIAAAAVRRMETVEELEACEVLGTWAEALLPARDSEQLRRACAGEH